MTTLRCPDCGELCWHTGTSGMENQFCFSCVGSSHKNPLHWQRYYSIVELVREPECEICHTPEDELPLCYSRAPDGWKCGRKLNHLHGAHDSLRRKA